MSEHAKDTKVEAKSDVKPAGKPRRPVETIAHERGLLPEFTPGEKPAHLPKAIVPPVHNPKYAVYARARVFHRWPIGFEMTDEEFDAAVSAAEKASVYR